MYHQPVRFHSTDQGSVSLVTENRYKKSLILIENKKTEYIREKEGSNKNIFLLFSFEGKVLFNYFKNFFSVITYRGFLQFLTHSRWVVYITTRVKSSNIWALFKNESDTSFPAVYCSGAI